ncbi:unnamed protein product [Chondrus crispus]|uniref:Uncharacterized protein n=1 Tax=Chondrus crispus TaxID=2769 RepID=R7QBH6_CHOCR|nr:unnamed protein product [Chondrus crispus]CDF35862.1 unnamed protein product [Chondrus crispus]|eukprot:XP_005715681.1 unnamed protein product [Chondrus crispus]
MHLIYTPFTALTTSELSFCLFSSHHTQDNIGRHSRCKRCLSSQDDAPALSQLPQVLGIQQGGSPMRERIYIRGVELLRLELDLLILVWCNGNFTGLPIAALLRRGHKMPCELLHQLGSHLLAILGDDAGAILNLDDHSVGRVVAVEDQADLDAEVEKVVLSSADRARELVLVRADALDHRQEGRLGLADG